ncbi:ribonuclease J [Candidatus Peregrinibacteria bacterium]|nr:ribonuclease J [Candidatus Peregrinibacteria bacterium]
MKENFQKHVTSHAHRVPPSRPAHFYRGRPSSPHAHSPRINKPPHHIRGDVLRVIPLGGLNEVGQNTMVFECGNDIVVIDLGLQFPEIGMPGIDYIIPDTAYLEQRKNRIRGIIITHGHLDHIGGIPYLIEKLGFPPIFSAKLTAGFIKKQLEEFGLERRAKIHIFDPDKAILRFGRIEAAFFRVNHSIPDAVGVLLKTPAGNIVHTGDFKFDETPARDQKPADLQHIAKIGASNVLALFSDSTNALEPGRTMSETSIGANLEPLIVNAKGRMIIASFSSLIGRLQQVFDIALKHKKKVFLSGRSMHDSVEIARNLGYLRYPANLVKDINHLGGPDKDTIILTTGSQGEEFSSLTRIAQKEHQFVKIKPGDTVLISASPIIGNERAISNVINNLAKLGANIIHDRTLDVHTSGHGCQEDLKMMIDLIKPKYLVPIHGEYFMRQAHKALGIEMGIKDENIILIENGDILELGAGKVHASHQKIKLEHILIDGYGVGDIGTQILYERNKMSENGIVIVLLTINAKTRKLNAKIDIISRGFVFMQKSEEVIEKMKKVAEAAYQEITKKHPGAKRSDIKRYIANKLQKTTEDQLDRKPLILPVIVEI